MYGAQKSGAFLTLHWLDNNLARKSATLACRRFKGTHSAERIAQLLIQLHIKFKIDRKIIATVTDNGSNFVRAFHKFGIKSSSIRRDEEEEAGNEGDNITDDELDDEKIETADDTALFSLLPRHIRCASHTLNLCLSVDILKSIETSPRTADIHKTVMKKCNKLWRFANRPKSAEIIHEILGTTLSRPGDTRWNSLYDSWRQIVAIQPKCNELFNALNIKNTLTTDEFHYIKEHIKITQPAASLMDILQGEKNIYYGILLPSLVSLDRKMLNLKSETWNYCLPVLDGLHASIKTRFAQFYSFDSAESHNAAIAAFSYPRFKQWWLQSDTIDKKHHETLLMAFKDAVYKKNPTAYADEPPSPTIDDNDFFDFGNTTPQNSPQSNILDYEIRQFFDDPSSTLQCLDRYPTIKNVFKQFNSPLPSSAPVERLFSYATIVNTPKANRLCDEMFEYRVVLKTNMELLESYENL